MVKGIQYEGGISSIRWRIFSTDMSQHQYGVGTSSVQWKHALCTCHVISTKKGVQYMATKTRGSWWLYLSRKMIFYRQYNTGFILL